MKRRLTAFVAMIFVFIVSAFAANAYKTITVSYDIKLSINGDVPVLTDADGNKVQPFTYNGTTYVPIRAVSENLGAYVGYDASTKTAIVTSDETQKDNYQDLLTYAAYVSGCFKQNITYYEGSFTAKIKNPISFYNTACNQVENLRYMVNNKITQESQFYQESAYIVAYANMCKDYMGKIEDNYQSLISSYTQESINLFFDTTSYAKDSANKIDEMALAGAVNQF